MAAQLVAMNRPARPLAPWTARAYTSFPTPVSPTISSSPSEAARRRSRSQATATAGGPAEDHPRPISLRAGRERRLDGRERPLGPVRHAAQTTTARDSSRAGGSATREARELARRLRQRVAVAELAGRVAAPARDRAVLVSRARVRRADRELQDLRQAG